MEYSGETTGSRLGSSGRPSDCIQQMTVFNVQWTDCPFEVEDEVRDLWCDNELRNDHCYYPWDSREDAEKYPIIAEFLKSRNVEECLIHWWW